MPPKRLTGGCGAGASSGADWNGEDDAIGSISSPVDTDNLLDTSLARAGKPSSKYQGITGPCQGSVAQSTKNGKAPGLKKNMTKLNGGEPAANGLQLRPGLAKKFSTVVSGVQKVRTDLSAIAKGNNNMLNAATGTHAPVSGKRPSSEPVKRPIDKTKLRKSDAYAALPLSSQQRAPVSYPAAKKPSRATIPPQSAYGGSKQPQAGASTTSDQTRRKRTAQSHVPVNSSTSRRSALVNTSLSRSSSSSSSNISNDNWRNGNNSGSSLSNLDSSNKHRRAAARGNARRTEDAAAVERKKSAAGTSSEHALTLDSSSDEESGPPDPTKPLSTAAAFCFVGSHSLGPCTVRWPAVASKQGEGGRCSSAGCTEAGADGGVRAGAVEIQLESQGTVTIDASEMVSWFVERLKSHRVPLPVMLRTAAGQPLHQRFKDGDGVYDPTNDDQVLLLLQADSSDNSNASSSAPPTWTTESEVRQRLASYRRETTSADIQDSNGDDDDGEDFDPRTMAVDRLEAADQGTVANALQAAVPSPTRRSRRSSTRASSVSSSRLDNAVVLQYPKEKDASDPVLLTRGDYGRLEPSEFLNDNLVDFYLKYLTRERVAVGRAGKRAAGTPLPAAAHATAFHVFTAHFYKKLTGKIDHSLIEAAAASAVAASAASTTVAGAMSDDDDGDWTPGLRPDNARKHTSSSSSIAAKAAAVREAKEAAAHANVARWTKEMNLFEMQFVFVPIVEHLHWSLAVVANLDNLENHWEATRRRAAAAAAKAKAAEEAAAAAAAAAEEVDVEVVQVAEVEAAHYVTPVEDEAPAVQKLEGDEGVDAAMKAEEEVGSGELASEAKPEENAMGVSSSADGEAKKKEDDDDADGEEEDEESQEPALLTRRVRRKFGKQPSNAAHLFDNAEVAGSESGKATNPTAPLQAEQEVDNASSSSSDEEVKVHDNKATPAVHDSLENDSDDGVPATVAATVAAAADSESDSESDSEVGDNNVVGDSERAPCLVFMDSLNMHAAKKVARDLRAYLKHEWRAKRPSRTAAASAAAAKTAAVTAAATAVGKNGSGNNTAGGKKVAESSGSVASSSRSGSSSSSGSSDSSEDGDDDEAAFEAYVDTLFGGPSGSTLGNARVAPLPLLEPPVPRQTNCCDCGVFCVQYVEEVLMRWPSIDDAQLESGSIEGFDKFMFSALHMQQKRDAIRQRIDELSRG